MDGLEPEVEGSCFFPSRSTPIAR